MTVGTIASKQSFLWKRVKLAPWFSRELAEIKLRLYDTLYEEVTGTNFRMDV